METEKETEQRELEGWREWLILLLRVHIFSPPLSLSLAFFLEPRLSAPGSHTRGASHPIITLKWLLPHQWRTGRLAQQWSSACFIVLVTFLKLAFPTVCVCAWRYHLSNCCDFLGLECFLALLAGTLHHSVLVGVWKMPDWEFGRMHDGINEVMQNRNISRTLDVDACQMSVCDWAEAAISGCTKLIFWKWKAKFHDVTQLSNATIKSSSFVLANHLQWHYSVSPAKVPREINVKKQDCHPTTPGSSGFCGSVYQHLCCNAITQQTELQAKGHLSLFYSSECAISTHTDMHVWTHTHKERKWAMQPPLCIYTLWLIPLQPYSYQRDTTNFNFSHWLSALIHPVWPCKPRGHGWRMLLLKSLREKTPLESRRGGL